MIPASAGMTICQVSAEIQRSLKIDGDLFGFLGNGLAVLPIDGVGIVDQLFFDGLRVVEDEHAIAADDHQFLLLEGIQPAQGNVRSEG